MKKSFLRLAVIVIAALVLTAVGPVTPAEAAGMVITVNTTDGGTAVDGFCSLKEALLAATNDAAVDGCLAGTGVDTIAFNVGGGGFQRITLSVGAWIGSPVIIDGRTQPGWVGVPLIDVDGADTTGIGMEFGTGSEGSLMRDLMVTNFTLHQVRIDVGNATSHITLLGNYLGTEGSTQLGGNFGLFIVGGKYAQIGGPNPGDRNVISGNADNIVICDHGDFNTIQGNYVGLTADGTGIVPGTTDNILISYCSSGVDGTRVLGNVIAGGTGDAISIAGASDTNTVVRGNLIGTNAAGNAAVGPRLHGGISVGGPGTLIGGTAAGEGNVIGNTQYGIWVTSTATNTKMFGNRIGTNAAGTAAIANTQAGIYIVGVPVDLGDANRPGNNLISGNTGVATLGAGIAVSGAGSAGTTIFGNKIGTDLTGSGSIPNNYGIDVFGNGSARISGNVIANSLEMGIYIDTGSSVESGASPNSLNCITGNYYFGVYNASPAADFRQNWWGSASGPREATNPEGTGDESSGTVFDPWLVSPPAACGNGAGTYDGGDAGWSYTGAWAGFPIAGPYNDTLYIGFAAGGSASFTFQGTSFSLHYLSYPGLGQIGVYLDGSGTPLATIDCNGAPAMGKYNSPALIPGAHTLTLVQVGAAGSMIAIDMLEVRAPVGVLSGATYDGANTAWRHTGTWTSVGVPGFYESTLHISDSEGATAALYFNGTGFELAYLQYPSLGSVLVFVDGSFATMFSMNGTPMLRTYASPTLTSGPHSVILYSPGPEGTFVAIDAITTLP